MVDVIKESRRALKNLDWSQVDRAVKFLRNADTIAVMGNGGGFSHASHFAQDLRKICGLQAFAFDNAAEMTARINDEGWEHAWHNWLASLPGTKYKFAFSVGGGKDGLSKNLPQPFFGITGANGDPKLHIVIPSVSTPVIEGCQSVIAHHIVEQLA